jgi:glycerol uptake facilitator-like aquaporin
LTAEALGTGFLLMAIVGSGILADKLDAGNVAVSVGAVAMTAAAALGALIVMFQPISGAHFNPLVTLMVAALKDMKWRDVPGYLVAQIGGGLLGVMVCNLMFDLPAVTLATSARTGTGQWLGEFVATFGLFAAIWASARLRPAVLPVVVPAYVFAAVWFTSSTCFANPAVTIGRAITDTLCGIRPIDVPGFLLFQLLGAAAATALFQWLIPPAYAEFLERVVPPPTPEPAAPPTAAAEAATQRKRSASGPLEPHG